MFMLTILTLSQVPAHMGSPLLHTHTHTQAGQHSPTPEACQPHSPWLPPSNRDRGRQSPHSRVSALTLTGPPPQSTHSSCCSQITSPRGRPGREKDILGTRLLAILLCLSIARSVAWVCHGRKLAFPAGSPHFLFQGLS